MNIIANKFSNKIDTLKNTFTTNVAIKHNPTKGTLNEEELYDLIHDITPTRYKFGKGIIINKENKQSNETDIFIYDDSIIPPYIKNTVTLVPIEAVSYAIEVKTKLNNKELETTIKKFEQLQDMGHDKERLLFAFHTDMTSFNSKKTELERYYENEDENVFYTQPTITALCISNKACYFKVTTEHYLSDVINHKQLLDIITNQYSNIISNEDELDNSFKESSIEDKYKDEFYKLGQLKNKLNMQNIEFPISKTKLDSMSRMNFAFYIKEIFNVLKVFNNIENGGEGLQFSNIDYGKIKFKIHKWIGIENKELESNGTELKRNNEIELFLLSKISQNLTGSNLFDYLLSEEIKAKIKVFAVCCEDDWGNITAKHFNKDGFEDYDFSDDLKNFEVKNLNFSTENFANNQQFIDFSFLRQ